MDSQQIEVLTKMLAFYDKRYQDKEEKESKFNSAALDLIQSGDITKKEYLTFCYENDVEPVTKGKKSSSSDVETERTIVHHRAPRIEIEHRYEADACGGGGGYQRSSC